MSKNNESWQKIYDDLKMYQHDFNKEPFLLKAGQIKKCVKDFHKVSQKEVRILCKQDSREDRPQIFIDNELFILPIKNGEYIICKGEGYVDIPDIQTQCETYISKLDFELKSAKVGNSQMQHLDFAYASSLIRTFLNDESLVLSIRGRKYTPEFSFDTQYYKNIKVVSVQTEVDSGFEGRDKVVLIEAKKYSNKKYHHTTTLLSAKTMEYSYSKTSNNVIFEKRGGEFLIWEFEFKDINNYNSICLKASAKYRITHTK
ncbi:type II restriction enzyme [Helicobacter himalayensis]|uniref:type II restriction enzyme n=1 Tax=Helicobacter himalayensis TaxID=1591088 RepID=UPI000A499920|nr:hypothetical protein [Helicobacter himalayensis]